MRCALCAQPKQTNLIVHLWTNGTVKYRNISKHMPSKIIMAANMLTLQLVNRESWTSSSITVSESKHRLIQSATIVYKSHAELLWFDKFIRNRRKTRLRKYAWPNSVFSKVELVSDSMTSWLNEYRMQRWCQMIFSDYESQRTTENMILSENYSRMVGVALKIQNSNSTRFIVMSFFSILWSNSFQYLLWIKIM